MRKRLEKTLLGTGTVTFRFEDSFIEITLCTLIDSAHWDDVMPMSI